ncbi:MAG: ABC transporter ATP-binding protein/permease [Oscillospiraceae bacterium]|nr:ABC transporter ATP-binding protein/permease [Oscillospiraceae bacterium]
MPITVAFDLNPAGELCRGELQWEGGTLAARTGEEPFFTRALDDIAEARVHTDVGCGQLELLARAPDGGTGGPAEAISVCRFSLNCLEALGEFCKSLNHYLETGELVPPQTGQGTHCPKCGRSLPPGIRVCLFCVDTRAIWRRAFGMMKTIWPSLLLAGLCMTLFNLSKLAIPLANRWLLDHVLAPAEGIGTLPFGWSPAAAILWMGGGMALCFAVGQVFLGLSGHLARRGSSLFSHTLRGTVYDKVQNLPVAAISQKTSGDLMKRVLQDTDKVRDFCSELGRASVEKIILLTTVAVVLFVTQPLLAVLALVPVPLTILFFRRFWRSIGWIYHKMWQCASRETSVLHDIIKGIRVVKTFGTEEREIAKFSAVSRRLTDICIRGDKLWALINPFPRYAMVAGELLVLYFGGRMVLQGTLSLGTLVAFNLYLAYLYEPLRWMAALPRRLAETTTCLVKIFEILDEPRTLPATQDPIREGIDGAIAFDAVQFGYKPYEPVLRQVSLQIRPREMIGLVGHSGAGKSTMINLVMRLYDADRGQLRLGDRDIKEYDYTYLRENIGVVFQETFLFAGTVYDNIAYAKPGASPADVIRAAKTANAHEFIVKLPDGYNTLVGEDGHTLSGGERQRVAIARAVLKDPKILILDEATSALDPETESKIQQALERLVKNRTTIAIAHRLSTLRHADRLAVIEQGRLAELGSHKELLTKRGIYYGLVMAQNEMGKAEKERG